MSSSYTKNKTGEVTIFEVIPNGTAPTSTGDSNLPPKKEPNWLYIIIGIALCLTGCGIIVGIPLIVYAAFFSTAGSSKPLNNLVFGKRMPFVCPVTIQVSPTSIIIPPQLPSQGIDSEVSLADIHRIVTRNYVLEDQGYMTVTTTGAAAVGASYRAKIAKEMGWAVDIETGGRAIILAFGLDEVTARGLMEDVIRASGNKFS